MTILVTGATGNAGGGVVRALAGAGEGVRAFVRPGSDRSALPEGVDAATGDLNKPETLREALGGVNAVFVLSGYDNLAETLEEMKSAGVERVVLLSSSAAPGGDLSNAVARYHILSERAVSESGLPWTFLRPNSLMSNTYRWLPQLRVGDVISLPFGDVPIATIDPDDLGAVAAEALTTADHESHAYRLSGPEALLPREQVAILGEALGRDLRFEGQSNDQAREEMSKSMPAEYVDAFMSFFAEGAIDESTVLPMVKEITGREPGTFQRWARAHADDFRSPRP
jgi:uncharacterized protein YbjT (DUF2867 family)